MYRKPKDTIETVKTDKFSKGAGYKINVQKSVLLPCTNNELTEKEVTRAAQFMTATNKT